MPYEIETKDGIVIRGIPDHIKPDDPSIKAKVTNARQAANMPRVSAEDRAMANPTAGNGFWQNAIEGVGKAVSDTGHGLKQLGAEGLNSISPNLVSNQTVQNLRKQTDETRRLDAPLMDTAGGFTGNLAGNVAMTLAPGAGLRAVGMGARAAGAGNAAEMFRLAGNAAIVPRSIAGAGVQGAAMGAIQPVGQDDSRSVNAGMGGVLGAAVPTVAWAGRTAHAALEPLTAGGRENIVGRALNAAAGADAPAVAQRLANARELVPGSAPTAAQVAENGGVAAMERAASAVDPSAYTQRAMEQAAARSSALRGIAGTEQDLANAKAVRELMSELPYEQAKSQRVPITISDRKISEFMERPAIVEAWKEAERMAQNQGIKTVTAKGELTGEGLHYLKLGLDEQIKRAVPGGTDQKILMGLRNELRGWMEKAIPEYKNAREAFASWSPTVNQHQVGQFLENKLAPALADHGALASETGAQFANALRSAPQTIKSATGSGAVKSLDQIMSPSQMNTLENIAADLARKSNAQNLGRGAGSDTVQKLAMTNLAQQSGIPIGLLNLPGIGRGARWVYENADQQMRARLAQALLNPQETAGIMRNAVPSARARMLSNALRTGATPLALSTPALINAQQ